MCSIVSSAHSDGVTSFPVWIPSFCFLVWWLWLGLPKLCRIKVMGVSVLVCSLVVDEMLSALHPQARPSLWVCHIRPLSCAGGVPLSPLSEGFFFFLITNACGTLLKAFSASVEMIIYMVLFLNLSVWCITECTHFKCVMCVSECFPPLEFRQLPESLSRETLPVAPESCLVLLFLVSSHPKHH